MKKVIFKRIKKKNIIALIIIFLIFGIFMMISYVNEKITPIMIEIVEPEVSELSTAIVNNAIKKVVDEDFSKQDIFTTVLSNDGKIQTIDFNPIVVNKILSISTTAAYNDLKSLEEGNFINIGIENLGLSQTKIDKMKKGIITEVPIGVIFKNSLLANIGPKIPIKLHYVGNVNSNIVTKINSYGINNALLEIGIKLDIVAQIILPLTTKKINLECYIPIAIKVIQGTVPNYYSNGMENQSQLYSLPF